MISISTEEFNNLTYILLKSNDHVALTLLTHTFHQKQKGTPIKLSSKAQQILFSSKGYELLDDIQQHFLCEFTLNNALQSLTVTA